MFSPLPNPGRALLATPMGSRSRLPKTAKRSLEFGHFPMTAERSNRIAQAFRPG